MKANHIFFTTVFLTVFCLFCFYFFAGASCPPPGDGEIIFSQDGTSTDFSNLVYYFISDYL